MKLALVLSGGGMFGAWQAGVWRGLAPRLGRPVDLVVGVSAGALNGYAIAGSASPDDLCGFWMRPEIGRLRKLPQTIQTLMSLYSPRIEYALTLTELARMRPKIVRHEEATWKHLAASCAIPVFLPQRYIDGRWYSDGGLLNPLPVWAAVELGATHVIALHALPEIPSRLLKPVVRGFRYTFGHNPPLPETLELVTIMPEKTLGSARDALRWKQENMERWIALGEESAKNILLPNCFRR
jgi:NTE family protein